MDDEQATGLHPYRPDDAARAIDPELDSCLRWCRACLRRVRMTSPIVPVVVLAVCVAVARAHWAGWLLFGAVCLWISAVSLFWLVVARDQSRFEEQIRRDPSQLVFVHIESEPSRGTRCSCELQLRGGAKSSFYLPVDMAKRLATRASQWPCLVTRTRVERDRHQIDCQLRSAEAQLRRSEGSLASSLAPFLLPAIEGRSCAELTDSNVAALKTALDELERLLRVAVDVDAIRKRQQNKHPGVAELLASTVHRDPPFSERATRLVHVIREALASTAKRSP